MSSVESHNIPLPTGYTIVERLGAGGYGEVWKATAPGGVEKAIKLVFGHCNEGMAEREQKALERIKSVRHPFILSIERYEIVESRLVIVTELADMSLQDEFQRCQAEGLIGIPRERLLSYLWDAAEALDFMVDRHSLQHLDVKPENLLIIENHTKVADFGLVKQLASRTLNSMMGGITPLYSAPEIFDDDPSSRSDQYSLAIVFQHMLTGSLPFPGRTPAQLAKQHTLAMPNLRPLSENDRQVIGKALAKDPSERFASCREFVSALRSLDPTSFRSNQTDSADYSSPPSRPASQSDTKPVAELDTASIEKPLSTTATQILSSRENAARLSADDGTRASKETAAPPFPAVDPGITDVEVPEIDFDTCSKSVATLFIGVGGLGVRMLREICTKVEKSPTAKETPLGWLAIDTDRESLTANRSAEKLDALSPQDTLHIPLRRPKQYRQSSQELLSWVSRRWLYNIPRSLQTRGFRPLGRIAAVDHAEEILSAIQSRLYRIKQHLGESASNPCSVRAVILAGMSGGTGSGTVIDLAQAVRSICQESSIAVVVHAMLGSTYELGSADSLAAANMFSLLTEIDHTQSAGNCGNSTLDGASSLYVSPEQPFDEVYAIPLPKRGSSESEERLQSIADYLLLESAQETARLVDALRSPPQGSSEGFSLRTFECIDLGRLANEWSLTQRQTLINEVTDYWLQECPEVKGELAGVFGHHACSNFARTVLDLYPDVFPDATDSEDEEALANLRSKRRADLKRIASAFTDFLQNFSLPGRCGKSLPPDSQAVTASSSTVGEFVNAIREQNLPEFELGQRLSEILIQVITDLTENTHTVNPTQLAFNALNQGTAGPLDCGYQRRSVLLVPLDQDTGELLEAFRETCHSVAACRAAISGQFLIREGSELKPLNLGARLAESYPDINDASSRLHARDDINWRDLRTVEQTANC